MRGFILLLAALLLLLLSCGGKDDPPPPAVTSPTTAAPTPASPTPASPTLAPTEEGEHATHARGTRTGVEPVDTVLAALDAGGEELSALVVLSSAPCTHEPGPGAVLCEEGQASGTLTTVFLLGSCAPNYVRELADARQYVTGLKDASLHAVYPQSGTADVVNARFQIILAGRDQRDLGVSLWVNQDGEIVGATACGSLEPLDIDPILAPPAAG